MRIFTKFYNTTQKSGRRAYWNNYREIPRGIIYIRRYDEKSGHV
jgi:hypothetical protein